MSHQGTWADALVIQAVADALNLSLHIIESNPFLSKFGNPSGRENLVMTPAYERANVRQTLGEGEGRLAVTLTGSARMPSFLGGIFKEKENSFQFVVNKRCSGR